MQQKSEEIKFPLGNNLYVSVSKWRGISKIHIRNFKTLTSPLSPNKCVLVPTRSGICLSPEQFQTLLSHSDGVDRELQKLATTAVVDVKQEPEIGDFQSTSQTPLRTPLRERQPSAGKSRLHLAPAKAKLLSKRFKIAADQQENNSPPNYLNYGFAGFGDTLHDPRFGSEEENMASETVSSVTPWEQAGVFDFDLPNQAGISAPST